MHALRSIAIGLLVIWAVEVLAIAAVALIGTVKSRATSDSRRAQATLHHDLSSYDLAQPAMADLVGSSRGDV
jgi:hypothetical protein